MQCAVAMYVVGFAETVVELLAVSFLTPCGTFRTHLGLVWTYILSDPSQVGSTKFRWEYTQMLRQCAFVNANVSPATYEGQPS